MELYSDEMTTTVELLIIWHSRTGAARQLADAAHAGAQTVADELGDTRLRIRQVPAAEVHAPDLLQAQGYIFCAPENLGSLSGTMKECLDRNYYDILDHVAGRPYAIAIAAGTDGSGACRQLERVATGWRLHLAAPALIARNGAQLPEDILAPKTLSPEHQAAAHELGGTVAGLLLLA